MIRSKADARSSTSWHRQLRSCAPPLPPRPRDDARSWWSAGRAALLVLVGALLVLEGCGLPSQTGPKYVGAAQSAAPVPAVTKPSGPDDAATASDLIAKFLQASVGANLDDPDAQSTENLDRLRKFMSSTAPPPWHPSADLVVIRNAEIKQETTENGKYKVTVDVNPIGTLGKNGGFNARPDWQPYTAEFTVGVTPNGSLRIEGMDTTTAGMLLLSETGFKTWYDWNPIYFWETGSGGNGSGAKLVPDMRYMPKTLSPPRRVQEVLGWLQRGASSLLTNVVEPWQSDVTTQDNPLVDEDSGNVHINLGGKAAGNKNLSRLARQIRWSLRGHPYVYLTVENQNQANPPDSLTGFDGDNAAALQVAARTTPDKFYVAGGTVHAVVGDTPLFAPGNANTQVLSAAIDRHLTRAAIVRPDNNKTKPQQKLWVSSPDLPPANPPAYNDTGVHGTKLSRPVWMTYPARRLLVLADNQLMVSTDDKAVTFEPVNVGQALQAMKITAFAVAPEGHRIAFIANGQLMVAGLQLSDTSRTLNVTGSPQPIATLLGSNEGVAWLTETVLVVGGKPTEHPPYPEKAYSAVAITLDGADKNPLPVGILREASQVDVAGVVADYGSPLDSRTQSWSDMPVSVVVEVNGQAHEIFRDTIGELKVPVASPSAAPVSPTAPFYRD
ncbi:MAG TPA: LpqB family beta-propeller domain-containing protein [Dactylosporangium sp.]|jgi:hypothetical protein|nr:LpqB family beta-propeller domain-containing protein [Dactylosporangium sp.]